MASLLQGRFAECEKIILVCDNLDTHTTGAFYEAFEPAKARELVRRIEFCDTPKHGSWLPLRREHGRRERVELHDATMFERSSDR